MNIDYASRIIAVHSRIQGVTWFLLSCPVPPGPVIPSTNLGDRKRGTLPLGLEETVAAAPCQAVVLACGAQEATRTLLLMGQDAGLC